MLDDLEGGPMRAAGMGLAVPAGEWLVVRSKELAREDEAPTSSTLVAVPRRRFLGRASESGAGVERRAEDDITMRPRTSARCSRREESRPSDDGWAALTQQGKQLRRQWCFAVLYVAEVKRRV